MHLHFDYNLSESKNRCEYVLSRSRNVNIILNREAKPIDILPLHERRTVRHRAIHSRQVKPKSNTKVFGLGFSFAKIQVLSAFSVVGVPPF